MRLLGGWWSLGKVARCLFTLTLDGAPLGRVEQVLGLSCVGDFWQRRSYPVRPLNHGV
jgi:hypothetical protein